MYKIELRTPAGKIVKSKKYESIETFLKWKAVQETKYEGVYIIVCYQLINSKWEPYVEKVRETTFAEFLTQLLRHLLSDHPMVMVRCQADVEFAARVTGYSEEYETVNIEFESDSLTRPENVRVEKPRLGWGMSDDEDDSYEVQQVPVKRTHVNYRFIVL